jgi:outer membrane lipoprotein-sorting protein
MENNSGYKPCETFKTGTKLIVPNDYASRIEIYIHTTKKYPMLVQVYDTKGLFEEFKFSKVEINPTLKDIDFSATNPNYKFK